MKKFYLLAMGVLLLASCSSPKYAYYFDYYDYNSGKKKNGISDQRRADNLIKPEVNPLLLNEEALVANAETRIRNVENIQMPVANVPAVDKALLQKKYMSLSKEEKREFRKELKSEVKKIIKAKKSGESIESIKAKMAMDYDLKMALIFGIVGIVLSAFGGVNSIFWILGVIAVVVAIVFLIKWLADQ